MRYFTCLIFSLVVFATSCFAEIYDCFLYLNEWEVLEIRLNELDPYVDFFVVVESTETFKGAAKPLHFEEVRDRFSSFEKKIIHVVIEEHLETGNPWSREGYQRNQIMRGLHQCKDDDIILISDVDEVPRLDVIPTIIDKCEQGQLAITCEQPMYRYFLNRKDETCSHWLGTVATTYGFLKEHPPTTLRSLHGSFEILPLAGWHFTSMGGYERFVEKLLSFSHNNETESRIPSPEGFASHIKQYTLVPIDGSFPNFVQQNLPYLSSISMIDPTAPSS